MNDVIMLYLSLATNAISLIYIILSISHMRELRKNISTLFNKNTELCNKNKYLSSKERKDAYEVTELLHDLTAGKALVEIKRVDPSSVFQRSVREL